MYVCFREVSELSYEFYLFIISPTVLAVSLDFNSKLQGLITELRGELGAVLRGNKDAKDRLLKSECSVMILRAVALFIKKFIV